MSETKHLSFNILTLRVIMMWPPNGHVTLGYNLKSLSLLLIIYFSAWTVFNGIVRTTFVESDGYDALIQRVIALIDFAGCIYMRYCFLEKIRDVNVLIEQLGEFEEFCPKEEIVETDETVQYYSKGNPNVLTRK
jgi:hypothetical protein